MLIRYFIIDEILITTSTYIIKWLDLTENFINIYFFVSYRRICLDDVRMSTIVSKLLNFFDNQDDNPDQDHKYTHDFDTDTNLHVPKVIRVEKDHIFYKGMKPSFASIINKSLGITPRFDELSQIMASNFPKQENKDVPMFLGPKETAEEYAKTPDLRLFTYTERRSNEDPDVEKTLQNIVLFQEQVYSGYMFQFLLTRPLHLIDLSSPDTYMYLQDLYKRYPNEDTLKYGTGEISTVIKLENGKMNRYSLDEDDASFVVWLCNLMNRELNLILSAKELLHGGMSKQECFRTLRNQNRSATNKQMKYACNVAVKGSWESLDGFFWPGGPTLRKEYMICNPNQTLKYKSHIGGQKAPLLPGIPTREQFMKKIKTLKEVVPQEYQKLYPDDWKPDDPDYVPEGQSVYKITRKCR